MYIANKHNINVMIMFKRQLRITNKNQEESTNNRLIRYLTNRINLNDKIITT